MEAAFYYYYYYYYFYYYDDDGSLFVFGQMGEDRKRGRAAPPIAA